jgi:integrase/recombinase XerD
MASVNDARNLENEILKERERLAAADVDEEDREAIKTFANHREGRVARNTLRQDMGNLRRAAVAADGPLIEFDRRADVDAVMSELQSQGVEKPDSKNAYLRALRQFFKYLGDEPHRPDYEWIENVEDYKSNGDSRRLKREEYLTEDEVTALREAAEHPREEALVEFLADTGARIGLVCGLRRKDVDLEAEPPTFTPNPNAKDGYKGVGIKRYPIHYSERHLRRWINKRHPDQHPDAPLFPVKIGYDSEDRGNQAMHAQTAFDAVKSLAEKTEIDPDRVSPHAFRHAAVRRMKTDPDFDFDWETVKMRTAWSDRAFESMKELYGALQEGEQLDYFAGRAGRDSGEDEGDDEPSLFTECRSCGEENRRGARFCDRCGRAISEEGRQIEREVQQDVGASKALADGEEITEEDLEEIAGDDALLAKLIEIRSGE